jgi:hypothetical protein
VFFVVIIIISLLSILNENPKGLLILIGLFFLSIFLNKTTVLQVTDNELILRKNFLLVIPFYQKRFKLSELKKTATIDYGIVLPGNDTGFDLYGVMALEIFTGIYFYKPRFRFRVSSKNNDDFEIDVNISKSELSKFQKSINKKLEYD